MFEEHMKLDYIPRSSIFRSPVGNTRDLRDGISSYSFKFIPVITEDSDAIRIVRFLDSSASEHFNVFSKR